MLFMFWIWKNFFSINNKKKTLQGSWKAEILSLESVLKIKSVISLLPVFQDQLVFLEERESEVSGDTMCSSRSSTEGFSLLSFPCRLFPRTLEKFCLVHQAGFCCCYVCACWLLWKIPSLCCWVFSPSDNFRTTLELFYFHTLSPANSNAIGGCWFFTSDQQQ